MNNLCQELTSGQIDRGSRIHIALPHDTDNIEPNFNLFPSGVVLAFGNEADEAHCHCPLWPVHGLAGIGVRIVCQISSHACARDPVCQYRTLPLPRSKQKYAHV